MNQTTQMHQVAKELPEHDCWFTPYYCDGIQEKLRQMKLAEVTPAGFRHVARCMNYLNAHDLQVDYQGKKNDYDLVVTSSDLIIQKNIRDKKVVLVQEGMTDPEHLAYHIVKLFPFLPRYLASTSTTGLSDGYDYFCVASEGYRDLFIRKGVKPEKIRVTGIPNFDNCKKFYDNQFPHKHFVLVCTSDSRETYKYENRRKIIENALKVADGRLLIFKLHPNENFERATREINKYAPNALVYTSGSAEEMIANCDVLMTRFSSTVYVGLALGKEVYSEFPIEELRRLTPIQNNGTSAKNIANVCRELLEAPTYSKQKAPLQWINADYAPQLVNNLFTKSL